MWTSTNTSVPKVSNIWEISENIRLSEAQLPKQSDCGRAPTASAIISAFVILTDIIIGNYYGPEDFPPVGKQKK